MIHPRGNGMTGLLWFDDSDNPVKVKIQNAVARYRVKYGQSPNTCYVNPKDLGDCKAMTVDGTGVVVVARPNVLKDNFWVGIEKRGQNETGSKTAGEAGDD